MTVNTELSKRRYDGNGVTTGYDYDFKIPLNSDLEVSLFDPDDIKYPQIEGTHYSMTGAGSDVGGRVTFFIPPPVDWKVLLFSDVAYVQPTDFKNQGRFFPETHENALDRNAILARQLKEITDRSMTLPPQVIGVSTELPSPEANTIFGWNSTSDSIQNFPLSTIATNIVYGDKTYQLFSGTGVQTNFILSRDPASLGNLDIAIGGVTQTPGIDYTFLGTTLTFTTAPPAGTSNILVRYDVAVPVGSMLASAVQYLPGDGSGHTNVNTRLNALGNLRADLADSATTGYGAGLVQDKRSDITSSKARTLRSRGRDVFYLAEILPQSELDAIAARTSTYDATQELRDALSQSYGGGSYRVVLPNGQFRVSDEATFSGTKHIIGQGRTATTITTTSTTKAIVRPTAGNHIRVAHLSLDRINASAVVGACGLDFTAITGQSVIEHVYVANQYDGIRLGPTDLGFLRHAIVENSFRNGVVRTTETVGGNIQWRLFDVLVQKVEGHGFFDFAAPSNGNTSTGEMLQCYTYSCKLRSWAAQGSSSTAKINALRASNCFFGESGGGEIYLDTYGADHTLDNMYIEISGASPVGRLAATAATNLGHGIEITANNGKGIINNARCYNNAQTGIIISAPDWIINNPDCRNNGRNTGQGSRYGVYLGATTGLYQLQGGRLMNDTGVLQQTVGLVYNGDNITVIGTRMDGNTAAPIAGGPAFSTMNNSTVIGCYPASIGNLIPGATDIRGTLSKGATAYSNP